MVSSRATLGEEMEEREEGRERRRGEKGCWRPQISYAGLYLDGHYETA